MAIEDEIINISDIDIGTEILNSDKLLIETSNGTKMIAFKDFVVGPDNISSVRQSQIEGNVEGEADTFYNVVTGFNILNNQTTPGLNTQYDQISGTVELGKFNFNAIANLASVSADIATNTAALAEIRTVIDNLANLLESTDSSALNSITLQTSACNCIVDGATKTKKGVAFTNKILDPATTNPNCTITLDPFTIKFPDAGEGFVDGSRFMIIGNFTYSLPLGGGGAARNRNSTFTCFKNKSDGSSQEVFSIFKEGTDSGRGRIQTSSFTEVVSINTGDTLRFTASRSITRGKLDIFKIS